MRDPNEIIDRLVAVCDDAEFRDRAEWMKNDLCYKAPEEVWAWATKHVVPYLEHWHKNNASWFLEAWEIWMGRPWQEGDPIPGVYPS